MDPSTPSGSRVTGFDIVMPSWLRWDGVELIMHKTARHLAREGNRVLFCEPPYALATCFLHREHGPRIRKDVAHWREGIRRVDRNLYVWTPPPLVLQTGIIRLNDRWNHRRLRRAMGQAVRRVGFRRPIVWSYHSYYLDDESFLSPRLVVFDCNDRIAAFEPLKRKRRRLDPMEESLVRRSDAVFVTARTLQEDLGTIRDDLVYLPSGVDRAVVETVADPAMEVAADLRAIPSPRIGYLGAIDSRIDWDRIVALADADPSWNLVFVGPELEPVPEKVRACRNVHFLGGRPPDQLAEYLGGFDVGLIPFRPADFVRYMFPTKTFEYLAAGTPVVSTPIPALEALVPLVRVADEDFTGAVAAALADSRDADARAHRIEVARDHTWESRFERADAIVAEHLSTVERDPSGPVDPVVLGGELETHRTDSALPVIDRWGSPDPDRITVLFLPTNLRIGGAERQLVDLAKGLDPRRFRPLVCCFREIGPFFEELLEAGIPVRFFDYRPYYDLRGLRAIFQVARILQRERVHVLQTYEFNTKVVGWLAAVLARTPVVVGAEHACGEVGDTPAKNRFMRLFQRLCDRFVYVAHGQRRFYEEERGLDPDRSVVLYNGIDLDRFRESSQGPVDLLEFGIPADAPIVGITAVLRQEKAHEVLFEAAPAIRARVPGVHFLVVGDGPRREFLEERIQALGLVDCVHFTGYRTDVERIVPVFDVAVLCSDPVVEAFPLSLLEAAAFGKPVVATDVGGVAEIVGEGVTGHLVPVRDPEALGRAVSDLLLDPARARAYGEAGRARIHARFGKRDMIAHYARFYETEVRRAGRFPVALSRPGRGPGGPVSDALTDPSPDRVDVLGIGVDPFPLEEVLDRVVGFVRSGGRHRVAYANVHVVDQGRTDPELVDFINRADLVYVDGAGIRLGARILGRWLPGRMTGADWIHDLCRKAVAEDLSLFFVAGRPGVAAAAAARLQELHPGVRIAGAHHGYLLGNQEETDSALSEVARCRPDIVLVGMGTPVQERWLQNFGDRIDAPVVWCVGALCDFVTGETRRGPKWMLDRNLEWLARLAVEPTRLWRRYLIGNTIFLTRVTVHRFFSGRRR